MIAVLCVIITALLGACLYLAQWVHQLRAAEISERKQVDELANYIRMARWIVRGVHNGDLDKLIAEHTPPPEPPDKVR